MQKMFPDAKQQKWVLTIIDRINQKTKTYLWVKTFLAVLGGVVSYIFFKAVGLNFAEFWAVMIFFLGYIPTIGTILGVIFPALLCLVQFESIVPFLIISIGCGATHFFIGNILEPKLLGDSMNLSTFVILFSLVLWSSLWGVIGAFLSVPITMVLLIVCAEFPETRPIAVALSARGKV
jgi:predicted PurR-regulated permease PerM